MTPMFANGLKAVLFDLDGTLIDTASEFIEVVHRLRDEHGHPRLDESLIRSQVSNGARALVTLALGLSEGEEGFESKRLRLLDIYSDVLGSRASLFPGISELLVQLDAAGIAWGISTNKPSRFAEPLLQTMAINPAAATVVCPDHVTHTKPNPEPLHLNCKHLNIEPREAVYVGDHRRDIEAGLNAGMLTIAALYGYIEAEDDPATWGADYSVGHASELAAVLQSIVLPA